MELPNYKEARKRGKEQIKKEYDSLDPSLKEIGNGKKYFIKTYGCQMNEHDSENISAMLTDMSFSKTDEVENADIVIVNTCSIRENAHNKAFGFLGKLKHIKEEKKNLIVGVCGCMAQEEKVVEEILTKYKWINFVFGTHNIHRLPYILNDALKSKKLEVEVCSKEGNIVENIPVIRENKFKA